MILTSRDKWFVVYTSVVFLRVADVSLVCIYIIIGPLNSDIMVHPIISALTVCTDDIFGCLGFLLLLPFQ